MKVLEAVCVIYPFKNTAQKSLHLGRLAANFLRIFGTDFFAEHSPDGNF